MNSTYTCVRTATVAIRPVLQRHKCDTIKTQPITKWCMGKPICLGVSWSDNVISQQRKSIRKQIFNMKMLTFAASQVENHLSQDIPSTLPTHPRYPKLFVQKYLDEFGWIPVHATHKVPATMYNLLSKCSSKVAMGMHLQQQTCIALPGFQPHDLLHSRTPEKCRRSPRDICTRRHNGEWHNEWHWRIDKGQSVATVRATIRRMCLLIDRIPSAKMPLLLNWLICKHRLAWLVEKLRVCVRPWIAEWRTF